MGDTGELQVRAALLDPPPFDPSKLSIRYLPGALPTTLVTPRCYTLTHSDLTGNLTLSIGPHFNRAQLAGWYTRILRDEVLAEWRHGAAAACATTAALDGAWPSPSGEPASSRLEPAHPSCGIQQQQQQQPSLHVYCHVSGEEMWPAPPRLRSFIFQREMGLVLDTLAHAEAGLLAARPDLAAAPVLVHLRSDIPALNRVMEWGRLGARASWLRSSSSLLGSLFGSGDGSWSVLGSLFGSMSEDEESGKAVSTAAAAEGPPQNAVLQQRQHQQAVAGDSIDSSSSSVGCSSSGIAGAPGVSGSGVGRRSTALAFPATAAAGAAGPRRRRSDWAGAGSREPATLAGPAAIVRAAPADENGS
eukprot:scaffold18.g1981.t1